MSRQIHHALVLNLHQPWGNLDELAASPDTAWEAKEILYAYDRIPRALDEIGEPARVHLAISGTLLEALSNPEVQARFYGVAKLGDLLWRLRHSRIDLLGTGYYHPVLPLIPPADRAEQVARWTGIAGHLFGRSFAGFWPPEMGFSMDLIPLLVKAGFRYAIVDGEHIVPKTPMRWEEILYRPHVARYQGHELIVIPRDRDLSNAQQGGMEPGWFIHELKERTKFCPFEPLVCTATDGDNGGWFRNTRADANFWGAFYRPFCEAARRHETGVSPVGIDDYIERHGVHGEVIVRTGSWNTGEHRGVGFVQWTGSQSQKNARERIAAVSREIHDARWDAGQRGWSNADEARALEQAMWRLLRAETSCHLYWGEAWVDRCHAGLDDALEHLRVARDIGKSSTN